MSKKAVIFLEGEIRSLVKKTKNKFTTITSGEIVGVLEHAKFEQINSTLKDGDDVEG